MFYKFVSIPVGTNSDEVIYYYNAWCTTFHTSYYGGIGTTTCVLYRNKIGIIIYL